MQVLIINLSEAADRHAFQQQQMLRLGLSYEIMRAVSTHHLNDTGHYHLTMGWERPLRKTELACFLSHHKAWQHVARRKQPMLILEDDALLARFAPELLETLEHYTDCDLVTLEVRSRKKIVGTAIPLRTTHQLLPLYQDRTGAAAYVLWPSGAQILLDKAKREAPGLADAFISSTYDLRMFQVEPAVAIQLDQCEHYGVTRRPTTVSSIVAEQKPNPAYNSRLENLRFRTRRLASQWRMGLRQYKVSKYSERRDIVLHPEDFG